MTQSSLPPPDDEPTTSVGARVDFAFFLRGLHLLRILASHTSQTTPLPGWSADDLHAFRVATGALTIVDDYMQDPKLSGDSMLRLLSADHEAIGAILRRFTDEVTAAAGMLSPEPAMVAAFSRFVHDARIRAEQAPERGPKGSAAG